VTRRDPVERFNEKWVPEPNSGCWFWIAAVNRRGYGVTQSRLAHRVSWQRTNGVAIPEGLCVLHKCDTTCCVNPDHLSLGTQAENMADMVRKGRQAAGFRTGARRYPERVPRGSRSGLSKLTEADVILIRVRLSHGVRQREIAAEFGVARPTVSNIATGTTWGHLLAGGC
jgi:hypothetical protein